MRETFIFHERLSILLFALFLSSIIGVKSGHSEPAGEQINWQVISSGGTEGSSANYELNGTVGQTATGQGSSANYGINHGFWQDWWECDCLPGDCDNNGTYNILDVTCYIIYLYKSGSEPVPYPICSGDPNCTCSVNILDVTYLINYLYKGGPAPCSCSEWLDRCGPPLRKLL